MAETRKEPIAIRGIIAASFFLVVSGCGMTGPAHDAPMPDAASPDL